MTSRQERLPAPDRESMSPGQLSALEEIEAGPRGALFGPFLPLIHSHDLMTCLSKTGEFLRFESKLDRRLFEMAILLIARRWDQQFEWSYHHPLALAAGLEPSIVEAIGVYERPSQLDEPAGLLWDIEAELHESRFLNEDVYARAVELLGSTAFVELIATLGYYTTLAMVMNAAHTPSPAEPALPHIDRAQS